MLPVVDKPLQYAAEEAVSAGIKELIVTGLKRAIEDHFDKAVELKQSWRRGQARFAGAGEIDLR